MSIRERMRPFNRPHTDNIADDRAGRDLAVMLVGQIGKFVLKGVAHPVTNNDRQGSSFERYCHW